MAETLQLAQFESFYVGGERRAVTSPLFGADEVVIGAMYVEHLAPARIDFPYPVVFVHGGVHTGVCWGTTPDGRPGWRDHFIRAGFDTYVVDQPFRGRSAPDLSGLMPGLQPAPAPDAVVIGGTKFAERLERGSPRFPGSFATQYAAQLWPDTAVLKGAADGMPARSDPRAGAALALLLQKLGKAVLVTHSQGGHVGWMATLAQPDNVAAIVALEPGLTTPGLDDPAFPDIPVLIMWGDRLPETAVALSQRDVAQARAISRDRPKVVLDLLPEHGICGNGHMLMLEDNSDLLAERAINWLRSAQVKG
jgi:pimeloyl-ACP methyl ester carboxylesterase